MKTELFPEREGETTPSLRETALAFWRFLKSPQQLEPARQRPAQVWVPFLQLFLLNLAAAFGMAAVVYGFIKLLGLNPFAGHKVEDFLRDTHFLLAFLLLAVVGPAIEELFFRWPLRYTRRRLFVALLALFLFGLPSLLELLGTSSLINILIVLLALMLAIGIILSDSWTARMRQVWQSHFAWVFYTFAVAFALIHLANFDNLNLNVALIPLLVLPQFVGGLFWGYIRLRFHLGWAILAHGLFNAVAISLSYLMA